MRHQTITKKRTKAKPSEASADRALRGVALLAAAVLELRRQISHLEAEVDGMRGDALLAAAEVDEELEAIRKLVKGHSNPRPRPGKRS
jgi:hypothetical protein